VLSYLDATPAKPFWQQDNLAPMIDEKVMRAIAQIESNDNQYALRFEPHVYSRNKKQPILDNIIKLNRCSHDTAKMIYSTSWGCWQLMGFNIYANNTGVRIGEFIASRGIQENYARAFLKNMNADAWDVASLLTVEGSQDFARHYNGPGDVINYGSKLRNALKALA
jgi:hypothetical protein